MNTYGCSKKNASGNRIALKGLLAIIVVVTLSLPAFAEVTFTSPESGITITQKAIRITGTATAASSLYEEKDKTAFDAGAKVNFTVTPEGTLGMAPYVGTWSKGQNNPVISLGGVGTYNEFTSAAGSVILDGNTYKIWGMAVDSLGVPTFGLWTSADGKAWQESSGISVFNKSTNVNAFDYSYISTPYVIKDGGTYKMWYTGRASDNRYRIGYATSTDGLTWTRENSGNPVLNLGNVARFDGGSVAHPSVIKDGNTYKMWYAGVIEGTSYWQIGYATSANGISWTRQNNSFQVLGFGKKGSYDGDGCTYPRVVKDGSIYRMWYIGINVKGVAYASSNDGISWKKDDANNPVITASGVSGDFDQGGIYEMAVMKDGLKYKMWYAGDQGGKRSTGYAEADIMGLTGVYISKPFNGEFNITYGKITWDWWVPTGTTGTVETRTSPDMAKWTTWVQATNNSDVQSSPNRYFQYRVSIVSTDSNVVGAFYYMSVEYRQVLRVDVSLDNSSWFIANGTTTWDIDMTLVEGNNTIYVKVSDTTPYPQYAKMTVRVDTTIPSGRIEINSGSTFTTNANVLLTLNAQDLNGISKMRIGNSDNLTAVPWEDFAVTKNWVLSANDGVKTVYIEFKDINGLISRAYSDTIILDTTVPEGSILINENATFAAVKDVHVTLKATDKNGISKMRVSVNESFEGANWGPFTTSLSVTLPQGDGEKWVYAEFKDTAGLTRVVKDSIQMDTTKPTGSITINNGTTMTRDRIVYVTLEASDANGIKDMMVSAYPDFVDGVWESYKTSKTWTLPNQIVDNYLYARFRDTAGLVSERASASIFLYTRVLSGSIIINNGEKLIGKPEVTLAISLLDDDGSTKMMVSNNAQFSGASWRDYTKTLEWNLSTIADGEYWVYVKFKDKYNMESDVYSDSIKIDTTPPQISISFPTNGLVWKSKNGSLEITGNATDETALSRVEVSVDGGPWIMMQEKNNFKLKTFLVLRGSHTVKARARDSVGNSADTSMTFEWPKEKAKPKPLIPGFESIALLAAIAAAMVIVGSRKVRKN